MNNFDHFVYSPSTPIGDWIKRKSRYRMYQLISNHLNNIYLEILEIGPGRGELAECFYQAGFINYTMVEPDPTLRNQLLSKGRTVKDYRIPNCEESDESYDAIILIDVFEHLIDNREVFLFMSEARRILKPGGIICIHSPDYLHWKEDFFNGDFSHSNVTSLRRTIQLFFNFGLRTIEKEYYSGFFTGIPATICSNLARLGLFFISGNAVDSKLYKLKLVFLRQFLIIGEKI